MNKKLIKCPNCQKQVLGEMTEEGIFRVMRFHNGYTDIFGKDFGVRCGNCGEYVFIRKEGDAGSSIRNLWVHRISFGSSFGTF
jgi:hypothetical protein